MVTIFRILSLGLVTAACAPLTIYHRPGVSVSRMQTDQLNCEVRALRDAPVANQVRQRPPIYFPGNRYCNAGGCYYSPGYWIDGGYYTVDVNADLRGRLQDQCMAGKGYRPVSIPRCTATVTSAAPPRQTATLPELTEDACVIGYDDGSWQIVNPVTASVKN